MTLFGVVPAVAVLNTSNEVAGVVTGVSALVAVSAILGIRTPRLASVISNLALALGVGVPIPTFCAFSSAVKEKKANVVKIFFMLIKVYYKVISI
jgi:hypothetical protein